MHRLNYLTLSALFSTLAMSCAPTRTILATSTKSQATTVFPQSARFMRDDLRDIRCSGVLVHPKAILSADHCKLKKDQEVRFGPTGAPTEVRTITQVLQFRDPDPASRKQGGSHADLALAILDQAVCSIDSAAIAGVPSPGYGAKFVGFGGEGGAEDSVERLLESEVVGYTADHRVITEEAGRTSINPGDSGGPLYKSDPQTPEVFAIGAKGKSTATTEGLTSGVAYHTAIAEHLPRLRCLLDLVNEDASSSEIDEAACDIPDLCPAGTMRSAKDGTCRCPDGQKPDEDAVFADADIASEKASGSRGCASQSALPLLTAMTISTR